MLRHLLAGLLMATMLMGSVSVASADASADFNKGYAAYKAGKFAQAVKWFRKAADQGFAQAQHNLGLMYLSGLGVTQDHAQAVKWSRKAADQGHPQAQFKLGWMHTIGEGVTHDYAQAVKWYRKAAAQGDARAQSKLGSMYALSHGVIQDNITAHMWWNIAASKGNKDAMKNRDIVAKRMTAAAIEEAQKRARECLKSNYKRCD